MQKTFAMSCTEVYEIINSLPKAEFEKIPLHEIEFLKKNKDNEYKFIVDKNINIEELTRDIVVELIEKIEVNADGSINIHYRFNNPYSV